MSPTVVGRQVAGSFGRSSGKRIPLMPYRIALFAAAIIASASFASAQTSQSATGEDEQQRARSNPVEIILDVSFLYFRSHILDELSQDETLDLSKLPRMKTSVILDEQECQSLIRFAANRMRASAIRLANGEKREAWPENGILLSQIYRVPNGGKRNTLPEEDIGLSQTYQATVSDDQRSIHVALSWNKPEPRPEFIPETDATVPLGSHWLIHTGSHRGQFSFTIQEANLFSKAVCWLFRREPETKTLAWREPMELYLLITPRLASSDPGQVVNGNSPKGL
jgi:hypothetical protein